MVILYRLEYQRMDEINEVYWGKKSVNKEWLVNIVIFCILCALIYRYDSRDHRHMQHLMKWITHKIKSIYQNYDS